MYWVNLLTVITMGVLFALTLWASFTEGWTYERITALVSTALVVLWCYIAHQWRREALTLYNIIDNARHVRTVKSKETK